MRTLLFLIGLAVMSSCKSTKIPTIDGNWQLEHINAPNARFDVLYPAEIPQMKIDRKLLQVSGKNGCNSFSGGFKIVGNLITFDRNMIATRMHCEGEGERIFMGTLAKVNAYAIGSDKKLILFSDETPIMRFSKK